jgi:hypothetical protein
VTISDYVLRHLWATGPCSFLSIQYHLEDQAQGITEENSLVATHKVLSTLIADRKVLVSGNAYYPIR